MSKYLQGANGAPTFGAMVRFPAEVFGCFGELGGEGEVGEEQSPYAIFIREPSLDELRRLKKKVAVEFAKDADIYQELVATAAICAVSPAIAALVSGGIPGEIGDDGMVAVNDAQSGRARVFAAFPEQARQLLQVAYIQAFSPGKETLESFLASGVRLATR